MQCYSPAAAAAAEHCALFPAGINTVCNSNLDHFKQISILISNSSLN